jgi:hypothetical protein
MVMSPTTLLEKMRSSRRWTPMNADIDRDASENNPTPKRQGESVSSQANHRPTPRDWHSTGEVEAVSMAKIVAV